MKYSELLSAKPTQTEKARPDQVKNNAGGFVFEVNIWTALNRFLILGTTAGSYYQGAKELTNDAINTVKACLAADYVKTINEAVAISQAGRAISNDQAIVVLALAASSDSETIRAYALSKLNEVCRTGTHILTFVDYVNGMRGWGRALKRAVGNWFLARRPDNLAVQVTKYKQRGGWAMRDVLRLAHPKPTDQVRKSIFKYVTKGEVNEHTPEVIMAVESLKAPKTIPEAVKIIQTGNLQREHIPTEYLNNADIWAALLPNLGYEALLRNLNKITQLGLSNDRDVRRYITEFLTNPEKIASSRIHPLKILIGLKQYSAGHGLLGSLTWRPNSDLIDAADEAFYKAFGNVEPTGQSLLLGIDVSGSMTWAGSSTIPNLSAREMAAAMALITKATEKTDAQIMAFQDRFVPLDISPRMRLSDVARVMKDLPFGRTDCSLPFEYATANRLDIDGFVVYTDNETYAGRVHPYEALKQYRRVSGNAARSAVVAFSPTKFTIADPRDAGMLDVAGGDGNLPNILTQFFKGQL